MPAHPPVVNQLVKDAVRLRVEQSNYDHASNQSLHTMVTQLMADIKRLSEVNANLEDENKSIAHRLDIVEEIVAELRNKTTENKATVSKTSSNNHVVQAPLITSLPFNICFASCVVSTVIVRRRIALQPLLLSSHLKTERPMNCQVKAYGFGIRTG